MTGFAGRASVHDQHLLKTTHVKIADRANKKQTLIFALCSLRYHNSSVARPSAPKQTNDDTANIRMPIATYANHHSIKRQERTPIGSGRRARRERQHKAKRQRRSKGRKRD
jgi:hypothetical protein